MQNLNLADAFAKFGAVAVHRLRALSAIAEDGAIVLSCTSSYFAGPSKGVLRYEDRLSRDTASALRTDLLGQHLTLARDGSLPVRLVVVSSAAAGSKTSRNIHVRADLVGKVTEFDGDRFVVEFTRPEVPRETAKSRKAARG